MARVNYDEMPALEGYVDHTFYQTIEWINFVSTTQKAEPVFAVIKDGTRLVGRFSGLIFQRFGIRILGSPFPGWTTSYMGFNLDSTIDRKDALQALEIFAFNDLNCAHVEIMDRRLGIEEVAQLGYRYKVYSGFEIDLTKSKDELFSTMDSACRRCIRKAEKQEVMVEETKDLSFADNYYAQLQDVFAKQNLIPTYPKERVQALIENLLPTGQLLLVRARNREGVCIATGIFPAMNDTMFFWGGASYRSYQILRPNEAIQWYAMQYWKDKGIIKYDMGGGGEYKRKYGGYEISIPWIRISKYQWLDFARNFSYKIFNIKQNVLGLLKH